MADSKDPTPDPTPDPSPEDQEKLYWEKLTSHLDTWFDGKVKQYQKTGQSRTGRTTLPGLFADMIFGPQKD